LVAARVFVTAADGLAYAPDDAWMHADDSFDRSERPFEAHYFDTSGVSEITVPAGDVEVDVMRGSKIILKDEKCRSRLMAPRNLPCGLCRSLSKLMQLQIGSAATFTST